MPPTVSSCGRSLTRTETRPGRCGCKSRSRRQSCWCSLSQSARSHDLCTKHQRHVLGDVGASPTAGAILLV